MGKEKSHQLQNPVEASGRVRRNQKIPTQLTFAAGRIFLLFRDLFKQE